jgi:putative ABC transport system substrate-binding protein
MRVPTLGEFLHHDPVARDFVQAKLDRCGCLRGARPADLPVQSSSKFEAGYQPQNAKTLSLDVPPSLLARADEVIE